MSRHLIQWSLILALAPAVAGQASFGQSGQTGTSKGTAAVKVVVLLEDNAGLSAMCIGMGSKVVGKAPNVKMFLLESNNELTAYEANSFASQVSHYPGVVSAELLQSVRSPESESCGAPVGVSAQQCTISFADGTPSSEEYYGQDPLKSIGYKFAQYFPLNKHMPALVALIDTGVDASHPAIKDNVVDFGWDFILDARGGADLSNGIDDDKDGYIDEAHGHGTHLASIIALMNPDVRILPLRVLDADGNGDSFDVADAITYAVDHGAQVINLSLSMQQPSTAVATAMEYAAFAGVSIFASAGNSGKEKIYFPGNYDPRTMSFDWPLAPPGWNASSETVTTIAAMGTCEIKASFSGYGKPVDLVAPGQNIYGAMPGGGYAWWSGTSMSTAVASGVASLLFSVGGESLEVPPQDLLETTAEPLDWKNWPFKGKLGKGSIDAMKASYEAADKP